MYEDIRKPKMLKDVPLSLIRPLPCLYYVGEFSNGDIPENISDLVSANIRYIKEAQTALAEATGVEKFHTLSEQFHELCAAPAGEMKPKIEALTRQMAELCTTNKTEIRTAMRGLKNEMNILYQKTVPPLAVLFVQYNENAGDPGKIIQLLENFCFYQTKVIDRNDRGYSEQVIASDFVVFNSTQPALIHNDVASLANYSKPGLAVVEMSKDVDLNAQSIRHAMQLLRSGFQVLFKVFTPIRLFTSIDREYIRFHLEN